MATREVVNGKFILRVIPIHDINPEDFVPPARKRPSFQKAGELVRMADGLEGDLQKYRYRPVPFGTYEPDVSDYLRLELTGDPTNKNLDFRLDVVWNDSKPKPATGAGSLPDPTRGMTDAQVNAEFTRCRLEVAIELLKAGRLRVARGILEDIVASYPKAPEAKLAQSFLDSIKDPKEGRLRTSSPARYAARYRPAAAGPSTSTRRIQSRPASSPGFRRRSGLPQRTGELQRASHGPDLLVPPVAGSNSSTAPDRMEWSNDLIR